MPFARFWTVSTRYAGLPLPRHAREQTETYACYHGAHLGGSEQ
jgi:hypothetical protein